MACTLAECVRMKPTAPTIGLMTKRRLTDADYAELAADYAANPITADEVIDVVAVNPDHLRDAPSSNNGEPSA